MKTFLMEFFKDRPIYVTDYLGHVAPLYVLYVEHRGTDESGEDLYDIETDGELLYPAIRKEYYLLRCKYDMDEGCEDGPYWEYTYLNMNEYNVTWFLSREEAAANNVEYAFHKWR